MASKSGSYSLSDKVLLSMVIKSLEKAIRVLRRSQDSDRISPHISRLRKVKLQIEGLYQEILTGKTFQ